jgi:hypothetical protein
MDYRRLIGFIAMFLCLLQVAAGWAQETERGAIEGTVLDENGDAVRGAEVKITSAPAELLRSVTGTVSRVAISNGSGKFTFADVPLGSYRILVNAVGFASREYGQERPNSAGIRVSLTADKNEFRDLVVRLTPTAAIFGTLLNETRQPISSVPVRLLRPIVAATGPAYQPMGATITDDRGQYRLFALPPGRYYLTAGNNAPKGEMGLFSTGANLSDEYPLQFFPGTTDVNHAVPIEIIPGTEMRFDMIIRHSQRYRISGTVIDAVSGKVPQESINLSLVLPEVVLGTNNTVRLTSYSSSSGRFELLVPSGSYIIQAQSSVVDEVARLGGEATWSMLPTARTPVTVLDRDIENVRLMLKRPAIVPGRVIIEGEGASKIALSFYLTPASSVSASWSPPSSQMAPDQTFRLVGIVDGEYFFRVRNIPRGFRVKSAQFGAEDILNKPWIFSNPSSGNIEVVLARETAEISGVVTNVRSEAAPAEVVLVPEARSRTDLYRVSSADQNGRFTFTDVAFGSYRLFAWEHMEVGAYLDSTFLKRFESLGKSVNILNSSSLSLDVRVISVP